MSGFQKCQSSHPNKQEKKKINRSQGKHTNTKTFNEKYKFIRDLRWVYHNNENIKNLFRPVNIFNLYGIIQIDENMARNKPLHDK